MEPHDDDCGEYGMNQRGFILPSPMMLMAGVSLALGLSTFMFYRLYQGAVDDYANFKSTVEAHQEQIRIDNDRKLAAAAHVNATAQAGWKSAVAELDKHKRIRVQPVRCPGAMPALSTAAVGLNVTSQELRSDTAVSITVEQCETVANNASYDAAQVVHLQSWITNQVEAMK